MKPDDEEADRLPPASRTLGRRIEPQDAASENLFISYEALPTFCNRHGTVQGGFLGAMLDSATALGLLRVLPKGKTAVTRTLTTRFLKPARPGPLQASVRPPKITGDDASVSASLFDAGGIEVAVAVAELRIISIK
jgi:uncharacterized protein (TIGR00369 family)